MLPIEFFKLSEFAFVLCNSVDIESNIVESLVGSIIAFFEEISCEISLGSTFFFFENKLIVKYSYVLFDNIICFYNLL